MRRRQSARTQAPAGMPGAPSSRDEARAKRPSTTGLRGYSLRVSPGRAERLLRFEADLDLPDGELHLVPQGLGSPLGARPVDQRLDDALHVILGQARGAILDVLLDLRATRVVDLLIEEEVELLSRGCAVATAVGLVSTHHSPVPVTAMPRSRA